MALTWNRANPTGASERISFRMPTSPLVLGLLSS